MNRTATSLTCFLTLALGMSLGPCRADPAAIPATSKPSAAPATPVAQQAPQPDKPDIGSGYATHAWLKAQASGTQASSTPQTLSGPVMNQVQERYIKSFATPVPDRFDAKK